MAYIIFFVFSLLFQSLLFQCALGDLICEQLPFDLCTYSVSSSGKRCILENFVTKDGTIKYQCKTSEVVVDIIKEWIETDECINVCGVDRNTVGISSDSLLQPQFLVKLCSNPCYLSCPNIVDLYYNLALAEGNYLPKICTNPLRSLYETKSSGEAASNPIIRDFAVTLTAPAQAPSVDPACAPTIYP